MQIGFDSKQRCLRLEQRIPQVERCKAIDSLVCKRPDFEFNSLHDWQPMEFIMQYMFNKIVSGYTTKEMASDIMNSMWTTDITSW